MKPKTLFNAGKGSRGGKKQHGGKGPKGRRAGRRDRGTGRERTEPLIEQPVADASDTVRCPICGHPVDPQRMHPHMVRFHGVAIRARGAWAGQSDPNAGKTG